MALSNLIWWPWFGKSAEEPVVGAELLAGDRRLRNEVIRRHSPSEDEELLIAVMLAER
jgi:hypothetical protein